MEAQVIKQQQDKITFNDDQIALIKKQIAPKATNDELQLFLYQAKRTGLDPLTRQIYCIHRYDKNQGQKMTIQTSIDGFRVIAERSGDYAGQGEPEFVYEGDKLLCCKIPVFRFRGDQRYQASVGVAFWNEYVPQPGQDHMWKKMPHTMLAKVAEALALRKAYPQDLRGLYTTEEMQQADVKVAEPQPAQPEAECASIEDLHNTYMKYLNMLISFQGDDAMRFHPDNWKGERNPKNYMKAIADIKAKVSQFDLTAN
jgi:phage recombination protein Bet